ncbi:hypothetical protein NQ318_000618 [Aromia moschata]|uniref:Reverse transcriptase domain-containing protein n=1 Tax=Aromia moschata TaxID=1265417 RepID=A0AAV8XQL5_9CUCU|nr:hypothetical protein NQ318_000618 [Aromia moschata]
MKNETDIIIGEYQTGFRSGRGIVDQIFALREIQAESFEHRKKIYVLFIDFKQAYDKMKREQLIRALKEMNFTDKIISMINLTLQRAEIRRKNQGKSIGKVQCRDWTEPRRSFITTLFKLALEKVIRQANINRGGLVYHKKHQCITYADDMAFITRSEKKMQELVKKLDTAAKMMGLEINEAKTKYMTWTEKEFCQGRYLEIKTDDGKQYNFEEVDRFKYLGPIFERQPGNAKPVYFRNPSKCEFKPWGHVKASTNPGDTVQEKMQRSLEQQMAIKFCVKLEKTAAETIPMLKKTFGVDCLSGRQIFRWHKALAEGREDVNDRNRAGRPSTSSSDDNVKRVPDLLNTDRRLSVRLISETLDITKTIVHEIVAYPKLVVQALLSGLLEIGR